MLRSLGADFGFAQLVVGACVTLWVITLLMSGGGIRVDNIMSALAPSTPVLFLFGASGAIPVFQFGRWWTVLSAGWLHAGLLHIALNMYWVWQMGPAMTEMLGPARTVIIYTVGGVAGFALSSIAGAYLPALPFLHGAGFTVGASAPVFGLIGALYHYGRTSSAAVKQQATYHHGAGGRVRRDHGELRHRQLRAPRGLRRRVLHLGVPQPDDPRARRPHDHRDGVPRRDGAVDRGVDPDRSLAVQVN